MNAIPTTIGSHAGGVAPVTPFGHAARNGTYPKSAEP
jgi:hypothetical protein